MSAAQHEPASGCRLRAPLRPTASPPKSACGCGWQSDGQPGTDAEAWQYGGMMWPEAAADWTDAEHGRHTLVRRRKWERPAVRARRAGPDGAGGREGRGDTAGLGGGGVARRGTNEGTVGGETAADEAAAANLPHHRLLEFVRSRLAQPPLISDCD